MQPVMPSWSTAQARRVSCSLMAAGRQAADDTPAAVLHVGCRVVFWSCEQLAAMTRGDLHVHRISGPDLDLKMHEYVVAGAASCGVLKAVWLQSLC